MKRIEGEPHKKTAEARLNLLNPGLSKIFFTLRLSGGV